uniref:Uncharacterized protein n=1 Tax=Medicago truncatula TaxID=3880 RepID=Q2HUY1_MEDTR|nr:hypothetical protein MtrDRAFT_AC149040g32v2 [Medicago truncatula]
MVTVPPKSFVAALGGRGLTPDESPLLVPWIKVDALCIRIGQEEYTKVLAECYSGTSYLK